METFPQQWRGQARKWHRAFLAVSGSLLVLCLLLAEPLRMAAAGERGGGVTAVAFTPSSPLSQPITTTFYLPIIQQPPGPLPPPLPPPLVFTSTEPLDYLSVAAVLRDQGLSLAYNKIGFHHGIGGIAGDDPEFVQMMTDLNDAEVPFFLKSTDNAQPIAIAQDLMEASGVPHVLVFRRASGSNGNYDVPDYSQSPVEAAVAHWQLHMDGFPPELDRNRMWIETINEVDKNRSAWLASFALETARLAIADGFRWAAFGWATGEPEREHWESPEMLAFLRFAGQHPDQVAIALHEYSLATSEIGRWYPYLVGRFQALFDVCDAHGIPRPTVLITEWGWEYARVPTPEEAMADIAWASWLYAAYPQVKGAAIWYLGGGFGGIAEEARLLIEPVRAYSLSHYFGYTPGIGAIDPQIFIPNPPTRRVDSRR